MKYSSIALIATIAFAQSISAQVATACAAQEVLDTCLGNEDTYLKTCIDQDYACLCKWHKAKLSCYDNCPNNLGRASEQGLKDTFCSIAQTYNTTTNSSSLLPSSVASSTALPSYSASVVLPSSSPTLASSSASNSHYIGQGLMVIAGVTAYFLI